MKLGSPLCPFPTFPINMFEYCYMCQLHSACIPLMRGRLCAAMLKASHGYDGLNVTWQKSHGEVSISYPL